MKTVCEFKIKNTEVIKGDITCSFTKDSETNYEKIVFVDGLNIYTFLTNEGEIKTHMDYFFGGINFMDNKYLYCLSNRS